MADEMHGASRASNNGFNGISLVGDVGIRGAAALGRASISEQARRHTAESILPMGHHGPPGGAGAARTRHQHDRRALAALAIAHAAAPGSDHRAKLHAA